MPTSAFGVEHTEISKKKSSDGFNPYYSLRTQGLRFRDPQAAKDVNREFRHGSRAILPSKHRPANAAREVAGVGLGALAGGALGAAAHGKDGALTGAVLGAGTGSLIATTINQNKSRTRAMNQALKSGKVVRDDPKNINYFTGLRKDAFGVAKSYTTKEKARVAGGATVGGVLGGAYLGGPLYAASNVGGQYANLRATKMHRAHRDRTTAKSKWDGNPHYEKWKKAQNLADRAGTPGEAKAAQAMADKISAGHGPFTTPKVKPLGASYKTLRILGRMSNPKTAAVVGFGTAAGIGAGAGVHVERNVIRNEHLARARRKRAA